VNEHALLVEVESFNDLGGWTLDTQFIHITALAEGSPICSSITSTGSWQRGYEEENN